MNNPDLGKIGGSHDSAQNLINDIQMLEMRAGLLGLTLVARSLNRSKNVAGWIVAGNLDEAARALNGERGGE